MTEELEGQGAPEVPAVPETPAVDPNVALQLAAQQLGVEPHVLVDSIRLQEENRRVYEENRRRQREIEIERAKVDALRQERTQYQPAQSYDDVDPVSRRILERMDRMDQSLQEDRRQREDDRQLQIRAQEQGAILHDHYANLMRTVPSQNQVEAQPFFDAMADIYPGGVPEGISPQKAVQVTARQLGIPMNGAGHPLGGYAPRGTTNFRDPRAAIVIPGGPTSGSPAPSGGPDMSPQRSGETIEQYSQRIEAAGRLMQRQIQESGLRSLPKAYSSE